MTASALLKKSTKKNLLTSVTILAFALGSSTLSYSYGFAATALDNSDLVSDLEDTPKDAQGDAAPVALEADTLTHDEENQIITASGNVVLEQNGRVLKADKVAYNLKEEIAVAEGNVIFYDQNGDEHHANYATLTRQMRDGFVKGLYSLLTDQSQLWAEEGHKKQEEGSKFSTYVLRRATYTACKPCAEDPEKNPPWVIKASKVVHDQEEHMLTYQNARMEVGGVPIFYTPYYSHPDGTVKRKSGFLTPSFGYNTQLGALFENSYYFAISPDFDATLGLLLTGNEGPVLKGEVRRHFGNGIVKAQGSLTYSQRKDSVAGQSITLDEDWRGHVFIDGEWHINDKWRAGGDINLTSDDQYLRQYDLDYSDFLMSDVYAERFSDRDYAGIRLVSFQDLRITNNNVDQPNLLPIGDANFMGDPNALWGGRWKWNNNILNVARDGNGQDVTRFVTELGWRRQEITPQGIVLDGNVSLRGDLYDTRDRTAAALNAAEDTHKTDGRLAPRLSVSAKYPLKSDFKDFQLRVEPQVKIVTMPDMDNDSSIPNEDSQDTQLDISNLFADDRFNGYDRIEDKTHISYGVRSGLYGHSGARIEAFVGQSYRFDDKDNPFSVGSGLEDQYSDYVGHLNAGYKRHSLNYRFELDGSTFESKRHELFGSTGYGPVSFSGTYLYASGVPGSAYPNSREEMSGSTAVTLGGGWSLRGATVYNISDSATEKGLTTATLGLDYVHDCYNASVTAFRDLRDETSGAGGTTVMFRIGFKNLGDYETSGFTFGGNTE